MDVKYSNNPLLANSVLIQKHTHDIERIFETCSVAKLIANTEKNKLKSNMKERTIIIENNDKS